MFITETIKSHLPYNRLAPNGWTVFNCPACHHRGHRPDRRSRGGIILHDTEFTFHCFNCNFKTGWKSGSLLSRKVIDFLEYLNVPDETIKKCRLSVLGSEEIKLTTNREPLTYSLPEDAKPINQLIEENYNSDNFLNVLEYIGKRNINLLDWYDLYYSDQPNFGLNHRFIIPNIHNGNVVGWVARTYKENSQQKYIIQTNKQYLFNGDVIHHKYRKFCLVTEGNLDAISLNCVATMGSEITDGQMKSLKSTDQQVILLPDKDKDGKQYIEYALDNNWWVALPDWKFKDSFQAVSHYGRIPAMTHILNSVYKTPLQIKIHTKKYFGE